MQLIQQSIRIYLRSYLQPYEQLKKCEQDILQMIEKFLRKLRKKNSNNVNNSRVKDKNYLNIKMNWFIEMFNKVNIKITLETYF